MRAAVLAGLVGALITSAASPATELGVLELADLPTDDSCAIGDEACSLSLRQLRAHKADGLKPGAPAPALAEGDVVPPATEPGSEPQAPGNATNVTVVEAMYKPFDPVLTKGSGAPVHTFYMYRAVSDEVYPPLNVNAANIAGVLWYLHHEVVIQYPRKFDITKIVRFKVQTKATEPVWQLGMNFGPRAAFDKGQCTGPYVCGRETVGKSDAPKFCNGGVEEVMEANLTSIDGRRFGGPFEWRKYGYAVGCNLLGEFPFPMFQVYYPEATWYSLPGPCPSMIFSEQTTQCRLEEPGGLCKKGPPTGAGDCTWTYEIMGEVTLDEIIGKSVEQLDNEGGREYDPDTDKGTKFSWWDGINTTSANLRRINETRMAFARKFPNQTQDEDMPAPRCDFNFGKFYHEFYWRDPTKGNCHDELPGSACYESVTWGRNDGIYAHPEWYPGLTTQSTFKDFQKLLYMQHKDECPQRPCEEGETDVQDKPAAKTPANETAAAAAPAKDASARPARHATAKR